MDLYKIGKVVSIGKTYIIFETQYRGMIMYCAKPEEYEKDSVIKIYTYKHRTDYLEMDYCFKKFEDRILFENLISVSGVGPRTAINIMKEGTEKIISIIANSDVISLSSMPSLGKATANKIIFDLEEKYKSYVSNKKVFISSDLKNSLKILGFNKQQIDYAVKNIKPVDSLEDMVESAIKVISNAKFA